MYVDRGGAWRPTLAGAISARRIRPLYVTDHKRRDAHRVRSRSLAIGADVAEGKGYLPLCDRARLVIRGSRPRNGWLWPIDRAGRLVPFCRRPLQYAEFGVVPFGFPTIRPPCVSLSARVAPMNTLSTTIFSFRRPTPDKRTHGQYSAASRFRLRRAHRP
jgi:hypothetical protein